MKLQHDFVLCGGTITEFEEGTLGDIVDFISTYAEIQEEFEQKRKSKSKNKNNNGSGAMTEKFSFGRAPELDTDFFKF